MKEKGYYEGYRTLKGDQSMGVRYKEGINQVNQKRCDEGRKLKVRTQRETKAGSNIRNKELMHQKKINYSMDY